MENKKRIYPSLQDLSPREYMYFPKGQLEMGKPGEFSKIEIIHLLISIGVLTFAFSFPLSGTSLFFSQINIQTLERLISAIPVAFLGLLTAFFVHELSHKFMAQKYGLWSEYRMYPKGLIISVIFAAITSFVFAAPGAVMFRGKIRTFEMGRIAAAGPGANIIIAGVMFILYLIFVDISEISMILVFVCFINALLAVFNLLPFGPLDGVKVIKWNGIFWAFEFLSSVFVLWLIFQIITNT